MNLIQKSVILFFVSFTFELQAEQTLVDGMWVENNFLHQIFCSSDEELAEILKQRDLVLQDAETFSQSRARVQTFFSQPQLIITQQPYWETQEMCVLVKLFVEKNLACKLGEGSAIDLTAAQTTCQ